MSQAWNVVLPPDVIRFSWESEGEAVTIEVDVIESQVVVDMAVNDNADSMQLVNRYQQWIMQRHKQQVSFAKAYTMIQKTREAYEEFKKKLQGTPTSPSTTDSEPQS